MINMSGKGKEKILPRNCNTGIKEWLRVLVLNDEPRHEVEGGSVSIGSSLVF
jgi:hypothetical protein